jgi:hypothetical protein
MAHGWIDEQVGISFQLDNCVSLLCACHSCIWHKHAAFSKLALFLPNRHTCKKEPIGYSLMGLSSYIIILLKSQQTDRSYFVRERRRDSAKHFRLPCSLKSLCRHAQTADDSEIFVKVLGQ